MKRMMMLLACCSALAGGAPVVAIAAPATVDRAATEQAAAERLDLVMEASARANTLMADVFDSALMRPTSMPDLVAKIDARASKIRTALDETAGIDASLAGLKPFGAGSGVAAAVADDLVVTVRGQVAAQRDSLVALAGLREAAAAGNLQRVNAGFTRMQVTGVASLEAAAAKAAELQAEVVEGRAALAAEVEQGPTDPKQRELMDEVVPLQRQTFDIIESSGRLLARAAEDARAGRSVAGRLVEFNTLQMELQTVLSRQASAGTGAP